MTDNISPRAVSPTAPMNVLSVVAFVLSLVGFNVIAVILGAVGLSQIKKKGERGRGFALAAIIIGAISIVIFIIAIIVAIAGGAASQMNS